jgi:hypothetical protein
LESLRPCPRFAASAQWLTLLFVLAGATTALGQGIDYQFNNDGVLPSKQGAALIASQGLRESSVYSVKGGALYASTLGTGKYSYYVADRFFNHAFPATLECKARVVQNDGGAIVLSLASGSYAWNLNLANYGIEVQQRAGWALVAPMDTRDRFHTYRVEIPANGSSFEVYADDVLVYTGDALTGGRNFPTLSWGDTVTKADSSVIWDYITLSQKVPGSLTLPSLFTTVSSLFDQTKAVKSGSTIPLKLQLLNAVGANVSSADLKIDAVGLKLVSPNAPGLLIDGDGGTPDTNFRYDPAVGKGGGYVCNLSTKGFSTGTYAVTFTVGGEETERRIQFEVR